MSRVVSMGLVTKVAFELRLQAGEAGVLVIG